MVASLLILAGVIVGRVAQLFNLPLARMQEDLLGRVFRLRTRVSAFGDTRIREHFGSALDDVARTIENASAETKRAGIEERLTAIVSSLSMLETASGLRRRIETSNRPDRATLLAQADEVVARILRGRRHERDRRAAGAPAGHRHAAARRGSAIFSGPPGRGKTHLAVAVAYRAIQNGFEAFFTSADELIGALSHAALAGRLEDALEPYVHPHVLVIDELGYQSYAADAANVLFRVVSIRHLKRRSTIVTTNKPLAALGQVLHDADLAEAILDRLLERGTHYVLRGRSYRTRNHREDLTQDAIADAA